MSDCIYAARNEPHPLGVGCDECGVSAYPIGTGTHGLPRELSANDVTNLGKIAALRGHIGKLRATLQQAEDIIEREAQAPSAALFGVHLLLLRALGLKMEDGS